VSSPETILIVDDDELLALMLAELLRGEGYRVWTARNGLHGYTSYHQHQPETVLADIEMPELDGFEMMRCIRAINPSVRTIYMSGTPAQHRQPLATEAKNFGVAILRKPFDAPDLLKLIPSVASEKAASGSSRYEQPRYQRKPIWKQAV
jgi:CheY-like chemotaxis protein